MQLCFDFLKIVIKFSKFIHFKVNSVLIINFTWQVRMASASIDTPARIQRAIDSS